MVQIKFMLLLCKGNKKDKGPIVMRVSGLDKELNLSTGINIDLSHWDKHKEKIKPKHPQSYLLNKSLEELKDKIFHIIETKSKCNEKIDRSSIKTAFRGKEQKTDTLLNLFDYYVSQQKGNIALGTLKHYISTKNKMSVFIKSQYKRDDVELKDLDYAFITRYKAFLDTRFKNHPNTATKEVKRVKAVINLAIRLDWLKSNPFKNFKCASVPTTRMFLTPSEISAIEGYIPKGETEKIVRDCFLFMAYTGLSYSDMAALRPNDIQLTVYGKKIIKISRQKTSEYCMIPLIGKAEVLISQYKEHPKVIHNGVILPTISNQKLNEHIKEIAKELGITKKVSCHIARHSFATNALEHGVPIETVSKALGHNSIKTTQIYAKITETKLSNDFEVFDKAMTDTKQKLRKIA